MCKCPVDNYEWNAAISHILNGTGCPECNRAKLLLGVSPYGFSDSLNKIKEECEKRDYIFKYFMEDYKNVYTKFKYVCKKHGEQISSYSSMVTNKSGCRKCGKLKSSEHKRIKLEEAIHNIDKLCTIDGYVFVGFIDGYKRNTSRFKYICPTHGEQTGSYNNFKAGCRCPDCAKEKQGVYGYYHNRLEEEDNLYVISIDDYIKVGRSFNLKKRFYDIKRDSGCEKLEMIYTLKGLHKDIYNLESRIHKELRKNGFTYKTTWSNETFLKEGLSLLRKYFEESI